MSDNTEKKEDGSNIGSFYMGRMRPPPIPQRKLPKGGLTTLTLIAFATIIWYAYPHGDEKYTDIDIPVVKADLEPYKIRPDEPGGMEIPHQDSTIFDPMEKKASTEPEKIMPQPEDPVNKEEVLGQSAQNGGTGLNLEMQEKPQAAEAPQAVATEKVIPKAAGSGEEGAKKLEEMKRQAAASAPAKTTGNLYIQLGSYRDVAGAKADWSKLKKKFPDLLGDLDMRTQRVDLGAKGVYNRLQAGKLSEARAKEVCAALKTANKGGCIVVR